MSWVLFRGKTRFAVAAALFAMAVLSRSYSGIAVISAYLLFRSGSVLPLGPFGRDLPIRAFAVTAFLAVAILSAAFHAEKFLSLKTRAVLVTDTLTYLLTEPRAFFLGGGSDAAIRFFSEERSERLSRHVSPDVPVDRAHFAFLDLALAFGVPFALSVFYALFFLARKNPQRSARETLGIFLLLSALHTPGIAAWVLVFASQNAIRSKP